MVPSTENKHVVSSLGTVIRIARRWRSEDQEFEIIFTYMRSSRPAWAISCAGDQYIWMTEFMVLPWPPES